MFFKSLIYLSLQSVLFLAYVCAESSLPLTIEIPPDQSFQIAKRIWHNESGGKEDGLLAWNRGEDFASVGIGHFIWYHKDKPGPFYETFPEFITFLEDCNIAVPGWLHHDKTCPCSTQEEWTQMQNSPRMKSLRKLLVDTIGLQAEFIIKRLERSLPTMISHVPKEKQRLVLMHMNQLIKEPMGLYAILDYLNFKGEGLLETERYKGDGWGLLQVLDAMKFPNERATAVQNFADSAKFILERRVANSPAERKEQRWLNGWLNRVATYTLINLRVP